MVLISAEMPASFEEEAHLKLRQLWQEHILCIKYKIVNGKHKGDNADICDSASCCQAWISKRRIDLQSGMKKKEIVIGIKLLSSK